VHPKGKPRLIQGGLRAYPVQYLARVEAVDSADRTLSIRRVDDPKPFTLPLGPQVGSLEHVVVGERIRVTVTEEVSIFLLQDGRVPSVGGSADRRAPDARVVSVDPSFRLLTIQFPNASTQTLKLGLQARMTDMQAGDGVLIRPIEATAVRESK
jgi:hypothetical protein